jgi:hypothetical protein
MNIFLMLREVKITSPKLTKYLSHQNLKDGLYASVLWYQVATVEINRSVPVRKFSVTDRPKSGEMYLCHDMLVRVYGEQLKHVKLSLCLIN